MKATRETFATDGQWNKFCRVKKFFEYLIELKKQGYFFLVCDEIEKEPFIDGYEIGFKYKGTKSLYVGCSFDKNRATGEYDIPWVDISITQLKKEITPLKKHKWC